MESLSSPSRQQLQDCVLVATAAYEEACDGDPGEDFQSTGVLEAKMKLAIACLADFVAKIGAEPRETRPESPAATSAPLDTRSSGRNPALQLPDVTAVQLPGVDKPPVLHPIFLPGGKGTATNGPPKKKAKVTLPPGATQPPGVAGAGGSGGGGRTATGGTLDGHGNGQNVRGARFSGRHKPAAKRALLRDGDGRGGIASVAYRRGYGRKGCSFPECDGKHLARGFCV
eukprot:gene29947-631_t